MKLRILAGAASSVTVVVTGIAAGASAVPVTDVSIVGARPAERATLVELLRRMAPSRIQVVQLTGAPRPGKPPLEPGTVRMAVGAGGSMEGHWQAGVLIRRYVAAAAIDTRLRQVAGFHPRPAAAPASAVRLDLSSAREVVRRAGATLVEARTFLGVAVAVVVRTDDPAAFLEKHGKDLVRALRSPQPQAASFFAVEDGTGAVVYEAGSLSALGYFWARPELIACGPITHLAPATSRGSSACGA